MRNFILTASILVLTAFAPQSSTKMSDEAKAAVSAWNARFREALDLAAAQPALSFAEELRIRVDIEQTGREALDLIETAGLPADQMRLAMNAVWKTLGAQDADNTAWLKNHLPEEGWFRISRDGKEVASNAWLIVQHSPDMGWQQEVRNLMTPLLAMNEVNGPDYALLYDRVEMFAGRPQRYGTQATCRDNKIVMHELEDPAAN